MELKQVDLLDDLPTYLLDDAGLTRSHWCQVPGNLGRQVETTSPEHHTDHRDPPTTASTSEVKMNSEGNNAASTISETPQEREMLVKPVGASWESRPGWHT